MLKMIVAADSSFGIGKNGDLPWHISEDMKFFRETTKGKTVIMGRKTLESFPNKKPLPNRRNIVLSRDASYTADGAEVYTNIDAVLDAVSGDNDAFVIGGANIYSQFLPYCDTAYITKVEGDFDTDTKIDNFDELSDWECVDAGEELVSGDNIKFRFTTYKRKV